ncbi:helix-turn-helix domain-containing protein [Paenibacillus cymbidii]|uniref:helix-turn-helix domain-containing protein n=1 Tax=Paenibacillus cymbidii TaxID=1639034 RepID=UPI0014368E39|nr:AraC family transcriptional regulator [Paenibacillus cymbidii]
MAIHPYVGTTPARLYVTPERPIHVNRVSESFELELHNHEFVEINYVSEGSGFQHIDGRVLPVTKGDLFYLPLGASHVFRPSSPAPGRKHLIVYNILLHPSIMRRLAAKFPQGDGMRRFLETASPAQTWLHLRDQDGSFQRIAETLRDELTQQKPDYLLLAEAEVIRLFVLLRRSGAIGGAPAAAAAVPRDDTLERIVAAVRERALEPLQLGELAAAAGLGERQFSRRFRRLTGMTFTDYVQKLRIERSCERLLATGDSVSAIARDCGYQDITFFNRLFKKKTGQTPLQYRKRRKPE